MKRSFLFIILSLFLNTGMVGNPIWIPIDNSNSDQCLSITTIESNEYKYKAKIVIHGFYDSEILIDGTNYHQLSFDEPSSLNFIGEPALPIISRLIALPKGDGFDVKIANETWSESIPIGQVMPSQKSVRETEETPPFVKDDTIYEKDLYQVERFYIGSLQRWRGVNNRILNICPVKYKPKEGSIAILKDFVVEITFEENATRRSLKCNDTSLFLNELNPTIEDKDDDSQIGVPTDSYDYLIITGNIPGILECQALADFQRWKAFKGYKTKVVSVSTIGTTATQIKQYISNEYAKGIKYVLFIGDSDKIPLYHYYVSSLHDNAKSDYWYGCMDGNDDVEADVYIGRFSTNDLSEFTNMVNKTVSYESKARSYGNKILLVANKENAPKKYQECSEKIRTNNYNEQVSFTTAYGASPSVGGDNATNAFVVNQINAKKNIINYRGHGAYDRWSKWNNSQESFCDVQINSLDSTTNDIYFCIACQNGNIYNQTCFMETFMRSNHGAAGMIAATESTYTSVNHTYDQYLFSKLLNENISNIGDLNFASHIANMGSIAGSQNGYAIYNTFSYLCGCDPSLEIWTDSTKTFNNYNISLNGQDLTINSGNVGNYKVSVVNEDGSASFVLNQVKPSCTFSIPTENFYIVLNKHNYIPRIIFVNVTDNCIQNKMFNDANIDNYYIGKSTISVGNDVTNSVPYGNVSIESGSRLTINRNNGVLIKNGFECKIGGELEIKK